MEKEDKYYLLYEDRYRRVHSQGIDCWISDPEERDRILSSIDKFLDYASGNPATTSVIEFGCGQGYVGEYLLSLGFRYLGVDISESAIVKARERIGENEQDCFLVGDVTTLPQIANNSYDIAIDNQCLHMLVTDEHRKKYLNEMKRILKRGGKVYFRENAREEEFTDMISSFQEWLEVTGNEYESLHDYPAYVEGEKQVVHLPRVPARFNNERGYRRELEEAGMNVEYYDDSGWLTKYSDYRQCIIYAGIS